MRRMRKIGAAALIGYTLLFFAFIYLPIAVIAVYSFNADPVNMMRWSGFTFDWYKKIFGFKAVVSETATQPAPPAATSTRSTRTIR